MPAAVSVVITCYNLEHYIAQAIESVLAQDFGAPVEIIVVDDCSEDRSAEIIRRYDRAQYIQTSENSGVLLATLAGIAAASGELLFFLDGDDLWVPDKLSRVVACFVGDPSIALVTHDLGYIDAAGAPLDRRSRPQEEMEKVHPVHQGRKIRDGILSHGDYVWLGSAFAIRRSLSDLDRFAAWAHALPDPRNTYQDWPLAYWVAAIPGVAMGYVPAKLFHYRLHQLNHSGDARSPARAVRNFRRTLITVSAMRNIALLRDLPASVIRIADDRMRSYAYLIDLYSGRSGRAAMGLLRSAGSFRRRGLLTKELVRFLAIQFLGPQCFAGIAARRSVLHDLPVS